MHVVQTLLLARMKKLERLIVSIERVVDVNHWPAHKDWARDLRERFTRAMSIMESFWNAH